jgi:hypothetical protein
MLPVVIIAALPTLLAAGPVFPADGTLAFAPAIPALVEDPFALGSVGTPTCEGALEPVPSGGVAL